MKPLKLAPTLHTPTFDEVPNYPETRQAILRRKEANIVEGFIIKKDIANDLAYKFYVEINIDNDILWLLLKELILQMPQEVALIYGHIDNEPNYGQYIDKYELINILEPYSIELTQDGFLEFGVIYNDEKYLEEIFIKRAKYIQYWGVDESKFVQLMEKFDLYANDNLKFIDEFPLVTEALRMHNPNVSDTEVIIDRFNKLFLT